mgnify:FL=1
MAIETKCLTSDAVYYISISEKQVIAKVDLPFALDIDEPEAEVLEALIHNQLELILRSYYESR